MVHVVAAHSSFKRLVLDVDEVAHDGHMSAVCEVLGRPSNNGAEALLSPFAPVAFPRGGPAARRWLFALRARGSSTGVPRRPGGFLSVYRILVRWAGRRRGPLTRCPA